MQPISAEPTIEKKFNIKLLLNNWEGICRVSKQQMDKIFFPILEKKTHKNSTIYEKKNDLESENPKNLPNSKWILTDVRVEQESENMWAILREATSYFDDYPPVSFFDNENEKMNNQFCLGRLPLFVHSSLYRALESIFLWTLATCLLVVDQDWDGYWLTGSVRRCPNLGHLQCRSS